LFRILILPSALSLFTVIQFPNIVCDSSTVGRNGTCYTANECQAKGFVHSAFISFDNLIFFAEVLQGGLVLQVLEFAVFVSKMNIRYCKGWL
jgi:hypothetical protein